MVKICPMCHTEFETNDWRRKFCGDVCAYTYHVESTSAKGNERQKAQRSRVQRVLMQEIIDQVLASTNPETLVEPLVDKYYVKKYNKDN